MATIKKNPKTGKWDIQYRYVDYLEENRKSTKRNFNTKKEAEAWYTSFQLKQSDDLSMKFCDFIDLYLEDSKCRTKLSTTLRG